MIKNLFQYVFIVGLMLGMAACRNRGDEAVSAGPPTGQIITLVRGEAPENRIVSVDVETGEESLIFQAPELSAIQELAVSSDGQTVYFSYTPPPSIDTGFFDRAAIYRIQVGESEPTRFLGGTLPDEFYTNPTLSPDGQYLFYHRLGQDFSTTTPRYIFGIERLDLRTMNTTPIVPDAIWPRVSPDGSKIVFITLDLLTQERGLAIADIDGSNMQTLLSIGQYFDIDSPMFSVNGEAVFFSIVEEGPTTTGWFDKFFGIKTAHAHFEHNIPSTWWRLEIDGGNLEQVSPEAKVVSHAYRHPDRDQIAYSTLEGLFVLDVGPREVLPVSAANRYGTVQWVAE